MTTDQDKDESGMPQPEAPLSPNHGPRRDGLQPSLIVLHYTGMQDCASARARLCDPAAEVSAHWLVDEAGRAEALVPETLRAWHAGAGSWRGMADINSRSIGVEIVNPGDHPFPAAQMAGLAALLRAITARWQIAPENIIAHSDMAPGRKEDPGPRFDWRYLALQNLSIWPDAPGDPQAPLGASLDRIGYPPAQADIRLAAFRLRFRPMGKGPESADDRAMADAVAQLFPA